MDAKVGVQTTANYRKLTKIFTATDCDQWHNVLKEEKVSHMETVWMTSCMRQVAKNAILGFQMNLSMRVNNGRERSQDDAQGMVETNDLQLIH